MQLQGFGKPCSMARCMSVFQCCIIALSFVQGLSSTAFRPHRGSAYGASAFATTEDLRLSLKEVAAPVFDANPSSDWTLQVDDTISGRRQEIVGFGAAWTDATVAAFEKLSAQSQAKVMDELFGPEGIELCLMRHTIGQSDLTPGWIGRWSYDENGGSPDPNLTSFDLTDSGRKMTAWLSRMLRINSGITLFGSPWSPPAWMKLNNSIRAEYFDEWAAYMVKYLQAFQTSGVKVDALTIQNEPLHDADPAWTTLIYANESATLAAKLTKALSSAGLQTQIWAYDHNTDRPDYPELVITQVPEVQSVAWHCYSASQTGWGVLSQFHEKHPSVKQYMTECWTHLQDESFFELPKFVIGPIENYASGALAWTLGGSKIYDVSYPGGCENCSGIIQVDLESKTYVKTQDYYTLGQFSKFVNKGALYLHSLATGSRTVRAKHQRRRHSKHKRRRYSEGANSKHKRRKHSEGDNVQAAAFLNPNGDKVVVLANMLYENISAQVSFKSGGTWSGQVLGRSVTTWVIGSGSPVQFIL